MGKEKTAQRASAFLTGAGVAAGLVYVFDPDRGPARRALVRDKARHLAHEERQIFESGIRDLRNRMRGTAARMSRTTHREEPDEYVLTQRIRARIGREVTHPGSVHVMVTDGRVVLTGPILRDEHDRLVRGVRHVRGVRDVDDQLSTHDRADHVPGLQGAGTRPSLPLVRRESWPASIRLVSSVLGAGTAAYGLARGDALGAGLAIAGGLAFARAAVDEPLARLLPIRSGEIDLQKGIVVRAPLDSVYALWNEPEGYPRFMRHVRAVRSVDGGKRLHWTLADETGAELSIETETTAQKPGELLSWRTVPGQSVEHGGVVRFHAIDEASTRMDLHVTFRPPRGASRRPMARLLGADPSAALDRDLESMRSLLEGKSDPERGPAKT